MLCRQPINEHAAVAEIRARIAAANRRELRELDRELTLAKARQPHYAPTFPPLLVPNRCR